MVMLARSLTIRMHMPYGCGRDVGCVDGCVLTAGALLTGDAWCEHVMRTSS